MSGGAGVLDRAEGRRKDLARFLRARREAISPEEAGLPRHRRRRTPGLRREEVADLAGIGAAWYAHLETARDIRPSPDTLLAICKALRLGTVETEYVFDLAGLGLPRLGILHDSIVPEAIESLVPAITGVGAAFFDRYLTVLRWNAVADAMSDISSNPDPNQRNAVRKLIADPRRPSYFGGDFEKLARGVVGMFRRSYFASEPTPFAQQIRDDIIAHPLMAQFWEEQVVADDYLEEVPGPFERHHPTVGSFMVTTTNLFVAHRQGSFLRIVAPADARAIDQFERLAALGTPSPRGDLGQ